MKLQPKLCRFVKKLYIYIYTSIIVIYAYSKSHWQQLEAVVSVSLSLFVQFSLFCKDRMRVCRWPVKPGRGSLRIVLMHLSQFGMDSCSLFGMLALRQK